jgi:hypothetical protein
MIEIMSIPNHGLRESCISRPVGFPLKSASTNLNLILNQGIKKKIRLLNPSSPLFLASDMAFHSWKWISEAPRKGPQHNKLNHIE